VTAAPFSIPRPRGFVAGSPRQNHQPTTPIYDALVDEFRLALRAAPGDQGTDERPHGSLFAQHYDVNSATRQSAVEIGHPGSRHRGLPEHNAQQF
jgi:hypothetical protein